MKKINIIVPDLPESISDATIVKWYKKIGDIVYCDDNIVDIETDKVMLEVSSPCDGELESILEESGKIVKSRQIIGYINHLDYVKKNITNNTIIEKKEDQLHEKNLITHYTPSTRRLMKINKINNDLQNIKTKSEIKNNHEKITEKKLNTNIANKNTIDLSENNNCQTRVTMSRLRQRIAERLLYSIQNTAMLTTFNEVNMKPIILLRKKYGEDFEKKHGIRIGFMSFFVKAVIQSLKKFPEINASIDQKDIIYYKNFDISIAISTPRGLITPVLRNAETMTMSEIEKKIKEFSIKGCENKIDIKDLTGGNFTITNGGIFGSLMSTPIINPPQTAILGMHTIQDRPMVINGKIKILPMMYLALSYDHRLIDGKESVGFLVSIKNILEDFTRILINI
ncbi:dihydrolipoyllysine-residue succinyltransferase [Buchnera aphidicola]|uniref:dihydrolipoyllysine-residue succinyltransferase n=1 Tax=Buchnera aphidicola TaxID=9 RepID=UPI003464A832